MLDSRDFSSFFLKIKQMSMTAEELRIGNIITLQGKPVKVNLTTLERLLYPEMEKHARFNEQYKGLELSEQVLLDCGFENHFLHHYINKVILVVLQGKVIEKMYNKEVKYLHDLQNLYYALTGEELEYKPKELC